ncbi:DUF6318 family protein [Nocardioides mesophilus]|uniref:DUF6318 domain-containing protein n=1 Tax=Nocardioides mesophilus TaxID=433659 RepID=A0A7G9R9L1_9ACTN|nr:DUF6318 family protein [Nocardioides mesophilus]QNN52286.1 hypothetical protein H9L09_17640 [Nocardioides mesophilus]
MIARLAALLLALVLGLSACGASTSDEAASGASERPAYADNAGEAGAEQFAGYWVDTLNEATTSGDTKTFKSLAAPDCKACLDFAKRLDTIYGSGGHVETDGWQIEKIVPEAGATDDEAGLMVTVQIAEQQVFAEKGAKPQTYPGGRQGFRLHLVRNDGEWHVQDLSPR